LVVATVTSTGSQVSGYGLVDGRPPDGSTVFELGSLTKLFTSLLLAELVQSHEVALDDAVQRYVTFAPANITLRQLASHNSGLPRIPGDLLARSDPRNPYASYTYADLAHWMHGYRPDGKSHYSNLGMGLLGYALAQRTGESYARLVRERILEPLGMRWHDHPIQGYNAEGEATPAWNWASLEGAGSLCSTADDMVRFVRANLAPSQPMRLTQTGLGWMVLPNRTTCWHSGETVGFHSFIAIDTSRHVGVVLIGNAGTDQLDACGFALLGHLGGRPFERPVRAQVVERGLAGRYRFANGDILSVTAWNSGLLVHLGGQSNYRYLPDSDRLFTSRYGDVQLEFYEGGVILRQNGLEQRAVRIKTWFSSLDSSGSSQRPAPPADPPG
jgi:D-alanyl-D-alanine-carboxypeptidase/D-alanyl-D-alanine-endopeptidase